MLGQRHRWWKMSYKSYNTHIIHLIWSIIIAWQPNIGWTSSVCWYRSGMAHKTPRNPGMHFQSWLKIRNWERIRKNGKSCLTLEALKYFRITMETKDQFEIIINVLVSSFSYIWILMVWVYDHYKYLYSFSAGIDFRRQILTFKIDLRAARVKFNLTVFRCFPLTWNIPWNRPWRRWKYQFYFISEL